MKNYQIFNNSFYKELSVYIDIASDEVKGDLTMRSLFFAKSTFNEKFTYLQEIRGINHYLLKTLP